MIALTGNTTMLYCPKCRRTYEDGTQRFCDNDGGRLLPAPSEQKSEVRQSGVFTNLLEKTQSNDDADKRINSAPRFIPLNKTEGADKKLTSFPSAGRIFQSEQFLKPKTEDLSEAEDSILELDPLPPHGAAEPLLEFEPFPPAGEVLTGKERSSEDSRDEAPKPLPRLIKPNEIASGTADVGNRRTNPLGREALSWENPSALLGQTVKGRYQIIEEIEEDDEDSLIYLAEDKIVAGKRVVVRVFMNDYPGEDDPEEKIFAEERVSLSHLKHPNIAGVFDSGELPEGNVFIVSEFVEGDSLSSILRQTGQFNALRTARIVRQTSYALSEAHQNGILHRNLKPENIVLTISEAGIEQVKLMNFGVSRGEITDSNLTYKAPEEIEGGISTYASDIYALAVIAYQMLTARLPFTAGSESLLLKAQKAGLTLLPTNLRLDLPPLADQILEKALSFEASERYPKARDFGDAFFNALTTAASWSREEEKTEEAEELEQTEEIEPRREFYIVPAINPKDVRSDEAAVEGDIRISPKSVAPEVSEVKTNEPPAWEKRSPEPPKTGSFLSGGLAILGIVLVFLAFWGISRMFLNRSNQPENPNNQPNQNAPVSPTVATTDNPVTSGDADMTPEPRLQKTPPGTQRFQNNRENLKGELAKNFLGFEIFYPQDWTKTDTPTNFLDISRRDAGGFPIEQMIVTRYESRGTMTLDRPNFPKLVERSNQDLKKSLGESFKVVSEGESVIQNGRWKVYEVKFQSTGENEKGEKVTLWGKRLWLPVQRAGEQNGFVLTLLATSLSDKVKSVDEVGVEGELANVLETFEPEQFR
jgi:serine/threonine protein kinase